MSNEIVEILPGDAFELGETMLVVQRDPGPARATRLLTHDYFEARLEDECGRAERGGVSFAVARVHCGGVGQTVQDAIAGVVRPGDVVASYGPGEYEVLLVDSDPATVEACAARLRDSLRALSAGAEVGLACYPRDARSPAALIEHANAVVRGAQETRPVEAAIGPGDAMPRLRRVVERVASSQISVVILGETGVGKSIMAAEIHQRSPRAAGPFVALNCAALPDALLESELFGHERAAFSGALHAKPGLFESAERGTVFLDEIGELPLSMQAKLLQVLETREVRRVGGLRPRAIDVRVLAASNRNLESEVARGAFRQDLYYRLNGISLVIPPLRERRDEVEGLARGFIAQASVQAGLSEKPELSREAMEALLRYPWPGNIRELRNAIERAVLLSGGGPITPEHLPLEKVRATTIVRLPPAVSASPATLDEREEEKRRIAAALEECGGNQRRASELLGISRRTLVSRLGEYGLPRPRKR